MYVCIFLLRCVICQMRYKIGDCQIKLPCKHAYHSKCIQKWLKINKASSFLSCLVTQPNDFSLFSSLRNLTCVCFSSHRYAQFATLKYLGKNRGMVKGSAERSGRSSSNSFPQSSWRFLIG